MLIQSLAPCKEDLDHLFIAVQFLRASLKSLSNSFAAHGAQRRGPVGIH
jgi:hypothetical protein